MKQFIFISLFFFLVFNLGLSAQAPLPHYITEEEKNLPAPAKIEMPGETFDDPPIFQKRTPAEWEEAQALVLGWRDFPGILTEIVRAAVEEVEVIICTNQEGNVNQTLLNAGVDVSNVTYIDQSTNSVWIRDYGQWSIYQDDVDSLFLVDWIYNRPRPLDDINPLAIADHLDLDLYETTNSPYDMVNTGGNFMTDGMGTGFASELVLDENDGDGDFNITYPVHTENEIDDIMEQFMGIDRYIKMDPLPYDEIHHIDMHMKLLDEETILVAEYPTGIADGPQIEENIDYIQDNFLSAFGTPYEIVRIPAPPENGNYPDNDGDYRTFTNSLFINKTVIVPVYGSSLQEAALDIYREQLPGYNIVGIDCNDIIPYFGALHCITKLVHTDDPIWIVHQELEDVTDAEDEEYSIEALIRHKSDIAEGQVYYRTDPADEFVPTSMNLIDADSSIWSASIPLQSDSTTVQYYIEGISNSGKTMVRPMTAPEGYWEFNIYNGLTEEEVTMILNSDTVTAIQTLNVNLAQTINAIFPNPAKDFLTIAFNERALNEQNSSTGEVSIVDIKGSLLYSKTIKGNTFEELTIPLNGFTTGIYFLRYTTDAKMEEVHQFVVE